MKKIFLSLAALVLAVSLNAQNYERSIFGVRAGVNVSTMNIGLDVSSLNLNIRPESYVGFNAGMNYQQLLLKSAPLYFETGLGVSLSGFAMEEMDCSLWYLQLPVMLSYKFFDHDFAFYPSAGLVYSFGVAGSVNYTSGGTTTSESVFTGDSQAFHRSDLGVRIGVNAEWKRIYLGVSYTIGVLDIAKTTEAAAGSTVGTSADSRVLAVTLGYNF